MSPGRKPRPSLSDVWNLAALPLWCKHVSPGRKAPPSFCSSGPDFGDVVAAVHRGGDGVSWWPDGPDGPDDRLATTPERELTGVRCSCAFSGPPLTAPSKTWRLPSADYRCEPKLNFSPAAKPNDLQMCVRGILDDLLVAFAHLGIARPRPSHDRSVRIPAQQAGQRLTIAVPQLTARDGADDRSRKHLAHHGRARQIKPHQAPWQGASRLSTSRCPRHRRRICVACWPPR